MPGILLLLRLLLALATAVVAVALVFAVMLGLNGVIPERDHHEMAFAAVAVLLLDTLVLAWMALLSRPT